MHSWPLYMPHRPNSIEQTSEASICSASQELLCPLWKTDSLLGFQEPATNHPTPDESSPHAYPLHI